MDDIEWIRKGLEQPGKTQRGLAKAIGRFPSAITHLLNGTRQLKAREIPLVRAYLEQPEEPPAGFADTPPLFSARSSPPAPALLGDMPKDVPVMGNASGGTGGDFYFNGQIIDYARRPPGIARASGVFALYVAGNSMAPRYTDGELIYATSARPAGIGDYVVVEMLPASDGADTAGYIKRLEKRTLSKVVCSQFNPPKTVEFELKKIKAVHRVIPWNELLGA